MPPASRKRRSQPQEEQSESEEEPTQSTQRKRRRTPEEPSSEEEPEDEDSPDEEMGESHNELETAVKKLVRYALACEYQRQTIKRAGITEKVIGKQRGSFKRVFSAAQHQLRTKFGMEMVELPAREKVTNKQKRAAAKNTSVSKTSASYILRTTLPREYRVPEIIPPSNVGSADDEASYIGLSTVLVSIIALSPDSQVPKHKLERYMESLNLGTNTGIGKKEDLIKRMKADAYLHEFKLDNGDQDLAYRVGPRGRVEIGNEGVRNLVMGMYGHAGEIPADLDRKLQKSLGMEIARVGEENGDDPAVEERENGNAEPGPSRRGRRRANDDSD